MKKITWLLSLAILTFASCTKSVSNIKSKKGANFVYDIKPTATSVGFIKIIERDSNNLHNYNVKPILKFDFPNATKGDAVIPNSIYIMYNSVEVLNYKVYVNGILIENSTFTDPVTILDFTFKDSDLVKFELY